MKVMSISESDKEMQIIQVSCKYQLKTHVLTVTVRRRTPVICANKEKQYGCKMGHFYMYRRID